MNNRELVCIECPLGCTLSVDIENCKVIKVSGNKCPKGQAYAVSEVENPMRILTATVCASGLALKMVPVRTDKPIPKDVIFKAMEIIQKTTLTRPVSAGEVIIGNILGLDANVIATRSAFKRTETP